MENQFSELISNYEVVDWSPYQSVVLNRIAQVDLFEKQLQNITEETDLEKVWKLYVIEAQNRVGFKMDNKVVIHLQNTQNDKLFIGLKDDKISLGLSFRSY